MSLLIFPAVSSIIDNSTDTAYQKQINTILKSAYDFSLKNISYLPDSGQSAYVTLGELKYEGLIDNSFINPKTGTAFRDNLVISINNVGTSYNYDKNTSMLEGNYLYTIILDSATNSNLLPTITLTSDGITETSGGNYVKTLDLNDELGNITYSAESNSGVDLTNKVKNYITKGDISVDDIDSSTFGIYKINYVVVDNNGYANTTVLNVIIADTTSPDITLPENNTITNINNFDLLNGVTCTDNSGFCDVVVSSNGVDDILDNKFIVEYTATDPSGNTKTARRVITIE